MRRVGMGWMVVVGVATGCAPAPDPMCMRTACDAGQQCLDGGCFDNTSQQLLVGSWATMTAPYPDRLGFVEILRFLADGSYGRTVSYTWAASDPQYGSCNEFDTASGQWSSGGAMLTINETSVDALRGGCANSMWNGDTSLPALPRQYTWSVQGNMLTLVLVSVAGRPTSPTVTSVYARQP